jgi:hypothetical protein
MKCGYKQLAAALLMSAGIVGCQVAPSPVSHLDETGIRGAVHGFAQAVRTGDAEKVKAVSVVPGQNRVLGEKVIDDTVTNRKMQVKLTEAFGYVEPKAAVVGSEAYLARLDATANSGPIAREGDRACVGQPGLDGSVYLRHVQGDWKVEVIPTLVMEAGGQPTVNDEVVDYRFGVSQTLNHWMLSRLENQEFKNKREYDLARNSFWMHYLTYTAAGKDPHQTMMSALPVMPHPQELARDW